ncbi:energy transducer TonB [Cellvibrio japonicus]|uniref:Protein TonB n=1 Tax=Cellvibrio japonicus (strain Ueda107) TaxID=498211 RepID=B3PJG5_CELJU|nr:energy transducer TonB [Cellvibrio japonicus]ACE82720.1 TonB2 protein [Cellvibrio japonicus Ueda107]QEI11256.1 energy transducer TonB [Cellvibrio japonicus]QEI14830.1 energy transducer TonB [Cellvibrio japonicus]QEI18410.1 energy transducer TonB [Cellvibrio japonicus]
MLAKYSVSLAGAMVLAVLVFLSMRLLIATDGIFQEPDKSHTYLNFVRVDNRNDDVNTKDRRLPEPPPPPETPPDVPDLSNQMMANTTDLSMQMPKIGTQVNKGSGPFLGTLSAGDGLSGFDTDVIPVVRVPPAYPQRAKQAKLEGRVTMAVTIRPDGTVADVQVLESDPPRLFDQAAIQAMQRWKFRPKIVNGKPESQRARQTMEFKLNQ